MKVYWIFLLCFLFVKVFTRLGLAIYDPLTVANNKFGIHVFNSDEVDLAASLVNTNGGEWGYITVPIQSNDRNREKWNEFMDKCAELKLIPIVRLATLMDKNSWARPTKWDGVDFANFLNDLSWPTKNRYVIVYNETNHGNEWGGAVDSASYARVLSETIDVFKDRNEDFFMLPAGMDAAAPNMGTQHMNWKRYLYQMNQAVPGIFNKIDGWNSHSYPNPAFSSSPYERHDHSIISYRIEKDYIKNFSNKNLPIFITETGWSNEWLSEYRIANYWRTAVEEIWIDEDIVAITPFVMFAGAGPFEPFSFYYRNMQARPFAVYYINYVKTKGEPVMAKKRETNIRVLGEMTEKPKVPRKSFFDIRAIEQLVDFIKMK